MEKNWTLNYIILDNILNNNKNLINKTINKYNIVSNKENNKSTSLIDYEKIMNLISKENNIELYTEFKALELLEIEKNIIEFLNNYISNKYLNTDIFLKSLNKLNFISDILSNKLNLQEIKSKKKNNYIFKTKYKLCQYKSNCQYNYGNNNNKCMGKHYVHNILKNDIQNLIIYINSINKNNVIFNNKEIIKSIKSFKFIIFRMWEELSTLCIYKDRSEWDDFHKLN